MQVNPHEECNFRTDGEKCGNDAITTILRWPNRVHRCNSHYGENETTDKYLKVLKKYGF